MATSPHSTPRRSFMHSANAMSTLVVASSVKRVDVSVVMMDRTALLYTPKAAKPTLVDLDDDDAADRPPHNA